MNSKEYDELKELVQSTQFKVIALPTGEVICFDKHGQLQIRYNSRNWYNGYDFAFDLLVEQNLIVNYLEEVKTLVQTSKLKEVSKNTL